MWRAIDFRSLSFRPSLFIHYWWLLSPNLSLDISDFIFIACSSWGFMGWQKHCGFFPKSSAMIARDQSVWFWVDVVVCAQGVELLKKFIEVWFLISGGEGEELVGSWCVPVFDWNHQVLQLELMLLICCDKSATGPSLSLSLKVSEEGRETVFFYLYKSFKVLYWKKHQCSQ